jgi:hypothetical protein
LLGRLLPLVGNRLADGRDDMSKVWRLRSLVCCDAISFRERINEGGKRC